MKHLEKTEICAAAALGLMAFGGGVASAQTAPPMSAPAVQPMLPGAPTSAADMPANPAPDAAQPGRVLSSGATTVTNGPVPDTVESRAKYGPPMSHAGKKTPPKGN